MVVGSLTGAFGSIVGIGIQLEQVYHHRLGGAKGTWRDGQDSQLWEGWSHEWVEPRVGGAKGEDIR